MKIYDSAYNCPTKVYFEVIRTNNLELLCYDIEEKANEEQLKDAWEKIREELPAGTYDMKERNLALKCWQSYGLYVDNKINKNKKSEMDYNTHFARYKDHVSSKIGSFEFNKMHLIAILEICGDMSFVEKLYKFTGEDGNGQSYESLNDFYKLFKNSMTWDELLMNRCYVIDLISIIKNNTEDLNNYMSEITNVEGIINNGQIDIDRTCIAQYYTYRDLAKKKVKAMEKENAKYKK